MNGFVGARSQFRVGLNITMSKSQQRPSSFEMIHRSPQRRPSAGGIRGDVDEVSAGDGEGSGEWNIRKNDLEVFPGNTGHDGHGIKRAGVVRGHKQGSVDGDIFYSSTGSLDRKIRQDPAGAAA